MDEKKMRPAADAELEKVTGGNAAAETLVFTCLNCRRIFRQDELPGGAGACPLCGAKLVKAGLFGKPK